VLKLLLPSGRQEWHEHVWLRVRAETSGVVSNLPFTSFGAKQLQLTYWARPAAASMTLPPQLATWFDRAIQLEHHHTELAAGVAWADAHRACRTCSSTSSESVPYHAQALVYGMDPQAWGQPARVHDALTFPLLTDTAHANVVNTLHVAWKQAYAAKSSGAYKVNSSKVPQAEVLGAIARCIGGRRQSGLGNRP